MTNAEFAAHIKDWTGEEVEWVEGDIVWTATQDGGELIAYFEALVKKMKSERERYVRDRESEEWAVAG